MLLLIIIIIIVAPRSSPKDINATVTSPYSAVLTWAPPLLDQQLDSVIVYIINVTILETNETFLLFSNTTSLTVNGLRPFRNYIFIIAAQNSIGIGPYSAVFIITTPQDGIYIMSCKITCIYLVFTSILLFSLSLSLSLSQLLQLHLLWPSLHQ